MGRVSDPIFKGAQVTQQYNSSHDVAAIKTYRYLRLGMLVGVAALGYSVVKEYRQGGVHCFLGSISGYYYTPVHPVFIGVMVATGIALVVMKGRTAVEDACLTLAGIMAPIVAFIPTTDDVKGVCRPEMLYVGHYQPDVHGSVIPASINNDLHAFVWAGTAAIVLVVIAALIQWKSPQSLAEYTLGTWINLGLGVALVIAGWALLHWAYGWVLDGHARAACAMFAFLAIAAIANWAVGFKGQGKAGQVYAWIYLAIGALMIASGIVFVVSYSHHRTSFGGHLVLGIEAVEIFLFVIFWGVQTVERWNHTV
jgi:hypothetical protein